MDIINMIIDKAIKKSICLICHDDIYIDEKNYKFCCDQIYHEKCLAIYIGMNMYAKCPICHKWVKKEIKEAFDFIFKKEYKLEYMRDKIQQTKDFTQDNYSNIPRLELPQSQTPTSTSSNSITEPRPRRPRVLISELEPLLNRRPLALRNSTPSFYDLFTIMDEFGERYVTEDEYIEYLLRRLQI